MPNVYSIYFALYNEVGKPTKTSLELEGFFPLQCAVNVVGHSCSASHSLTAASKKHHSLYAAAATKVLFKNLNVIFQKISLVWTR